MADKVDDKLRNSEIASSVEHELDGIHDGLEFPTEEEIATLRRVSDKLPWNAYLIATIELAERFSFYGCTVVFTNFIQQPLPPGSRFGNGGADGQSGALGKGQHASTGLTTFYQFWCYCTPLLGAYIADAHWGRYNTICVGVAIALVGHVILIVSAVPGVIEKSESAMACFTIAMIIMGLGTGFFKSNISPLVAEQYRRTKLFISTTKSGERVIVDPVMTVSSVYMYFYLFINIGALVGQICMAYAEKYVGFYLAYTLPTVVFLLCPIILWAGRNRYIRSPPTGSVFGTVMHLWLYAMKGRWSLNPVRTYKNMTSPDFWENAKPSKQTGSKPHWMIFDDQWVDEVRRGFKACAVFLWFPIYWLCYNQINNNLTSQAATMSTHGVPNDVLSNLDPIALIIFIPISEMFIYPALKRAGINFSALKKITGGFLTAAAAMIWAVVVQHYIYKTNPCGKSASTCEDADGNALVSPLNVWIQTGSYVLIAFSEILASITGLEYAFTKAPKNMRSLVMSVFLFMSALASALGEAFVALAADPLLEWNYGVFAVMSGIAGVLFWFSVRKLDSHEDELNNMDEGHITIMSEGHITNEKPPI
ncbi:probable PTR2-Di-and tripeptide permease [Armillaria ostoyae]|uniref:Probable PTR2-Di-and tripeptide permease n=1 Tax=Armillaria ostoyae TaxID=47428 RepID=A0A284R5G8_ARMOS|nr:probable PTR2-Di-and tripeptide permease [Armillaria ostoyae]